MPSKKRSRPSFEVPQDLQTAPQAGWVYRSDADTHKGAEKRKTQAAPKPPPAPLFASESAISRSARPAEPAKATPKPETESKTDSRSGILDLAAETISAGFETLGNAMLLTTRIIMMPFAMGMRILRLK
jgi:hypothetical protein